MKDIIEKRIRESIALKEDVLANDNIIAMDKSPIIDLLNLQRLELIASGE